MDVSQLNASIRDIKMPLRMTRLPVNDRGFPVPWFVAKVKGEWDFRAIEAGKIWDAYHNRKCWLCGDQLGQYLAFTIGPMCSVNRITSEPPSHLECAQYAVQACPFLSNPNMRRNDVDVPDGTIAGDHLAHNPKASAIWITKTYKPFQAQNGILFSLGPPLNILWYHAGHPASRAEVLEAMYKGLPELQKRAYTPKAKQELEVMVARAMQWIPKEEANAGPI